MKPAFWIVLIIGIVITIIHTHLSQRNDIKKNNKREKLYTIINSTLGIITSIAFAIAANFIYEKINDPGENSDNSNSTSIVNVDSSSTTETTISSSSIPDDSPSNSPIDVPPRSVRLDPNGGTISIDTITVYLGGIYPILDDPNRDYYEFLGWYTSVDGGYKVQEGDPVNDSNLDTLYAHWIENPASDWVEASIMPIGAKEVETKWVYTKESKNPSELGWELIESRWDLVYSGTHIYANFPQNHDGHEYYSNSDQFYNTYDSSAYSDFNDEKVRREIINEQVKSYIYYHWVYPLSGNHSETNRIIGEYKGKLIYNDDGVYHGAANIWESFEGDYIEKNFQSDAYYILGHSSYSYWWNGGIPVYIQSYRDYEKVYTYKREFANEYETEIIAGENILSVQKYVKYREK